MLQCQNYILGDQARGYQTVAEKAAVWCAQYKYKKRKAETESIPHVVPSPSAPPAGIYPFEDLCKFK